MKRFLWIAIMMVSNYGMSGQENSFLFTKSFDIKLAHNQLEFLLPIETSLLPTPLKKDEYFNYDLVLHSSDGIEVRIIIDEFNKRNARSPAVRFQSTLVSMATNDQEQDIAITLFTADQANRFYQAEWSAMAEFVPKRSLTDKRKGLLHSIYLSDRSQVFIMILYNKEELPTAYSRLMQFKDTFISQE